MKVFSIHGKMNEKNDWEYILLFFNRAFPKPFPPPLWVRAGWGEENCRKGKFSKQAGRDRQLIVLQFD
jgi:hypothetical protein